jgi:hypothetical protein
MPSNIPLPTELRMQPWQIGIDMFGELLKDLKGNLVFSYHFHNLSASDPHQHLVDGEKADIYLSVQNTSPVTFNNISGTVQKGPSSNFEARRFNILKLKPNEINAFLTIPNVVVRFTDINNPEMIAKITVNTATADLSQIKFTDTETVYCEIYPRP